MKLYLKARNQFLKISIIILILALLSIFILKNNTIGFFLLGLAASTFVITIQYHMSANVEESKLLIDNLKILRDKCFEFHEIESFSLDYFEIDFIEKYREYKKQLYIIFDINNKLGNISDLKSKTKSDLLDINLSLGNLEMSLHTIFDNFDKGTPKMKIIYFFEFYQIIKEFNFSKFYKKVSKLGSQIDSDEFYNEKFEKQKQRQTKDLDYKTSIPIYNKELEKKHITEYKALKDKYLKYLK